MYLLVSTIVGTKKRNVGSIFRLFGLFLFMAYQPGLQPPLPPFAYHGPTKLGIEARIANSFIQWPAGWDECPTSLR